MSDQDPQTDVHEEETTGGLSLEAKAGLTLICLLAATFGFMVWQKWKEMDETQVTEDKNRPEVQQEDHSGSLESTAKDATEKPELKPAGQQTEPPKEAPDAATASLNPDATGTGSLPPALNLGSPDNASSEAANPFADAENEPARRPANIPTLEAPQETASNPVADRSDDFSPFGDEFNPDPEKTKQEGEAGTTAETTPADDFPPFGTDAVTAEPATTKMPESLPDPEPTETQGDLFAADTKPKPTEDQPDPFVTAPDPFADPRPESPPAKTETQPPALDFADSEPLREAKPEPVKAEPVKTVEADPFGESETKPDPFTEKPAEKHPFEAEPEKPVKVTPGDSYQEPLPLLEPVPDRKPKTPADDPFGDFESVPAGAAQASSVTQVSPGPANSKRSGTLAELDATTSTNISTNRNTSPFEKNPFAAPQPKPVANEFKVNPDGTYEIRQGDTYWSLSRKAYGSSRYFRALGEYNRKIIGDPQQMTAGKKIVIPPVQELERRLSHLIPQTPAAPAPSIVMTSAEQDAGFFTDKQGNPMYRVQENDTLTGISQRHLGRSSRWIQIYELNRDKLSNPNQLKIGTTLKLPRDASRVRIVKGP